MKKVLPLVIGCFLCGVGIGLIIYGRLRLNYASKQLQEVEEKEKGLDFALAGIDQTRDATIKELTSAEYASAAHTATKFQEFSAYLINGNQNQPLFGVNGRGQAFGSAAYTMKYLGVLPELVDAQTVDGKAGYIYTSAYIARAKSGITPKEATQNESPITVYAQDGTTALGQMDPTKEPTVPLFDYVAFMNHETYQPFVAKSPNDSTLFGVNKHNETFGTDLSGLIYFKGQLDLVEVFVDDNGTQVRGYIKPGDVKPK